MSSPCTLQPKSWTGHLCSTPQARRYCEGQRLASPRPCSCHWEKPQAHPSAQRRWPSPPRQHPLVVRPVRPKLAWELSIIIHQQINSPASWWRVSYFRSLTLSNVKLYDALPWYGRHLKQPEPWHVILYHALPLVSNCKERTLSGSAHSQNDYRISDPTQGI